MSALANRLIKFIIIRTRTVRHTIIRTARSMLQLKTEKSIELTTKFSGIRMAERFLSNTQVRRFVKTNINRRRGRVS